MSPKLPDKPDGGGLPALMPLADFRRYFGNISHNFLYKLAAAGHVRIVKLGAKSLVDVAASRPYFEALPEAKIKRAKPVDVERGAA
jgi:hypothetical protein